MRSCVVVVGLVHGIWALGTLFKAISPWFHSPTIFKALIHVYGVQYLLMIFIFSTRVQITLVEVLVITHITKLPIIHIKNHIIITDTRGKDSRLNNNLYYTKHIWVHTYIKLNQVCIWLNDLLYMITKQLWITSCRFNQPTRLMEADLISN